ncbi:hypothetical protein MMC34_004853 [Xylographa carneopallida]|nr:hypothetical protein [Xylographa carneopallida]
MDFSVSAVNQKPVSIPKETDVPPGKLPQSKRASIEAWIPEAIPLDTQSEPLPPRKRKFRAKDNNDSISTTRHLATHTHATIALTKSVLHHHNIIYTNGIPKKSASVSGGAVSSVGTEKTTEKTENGNLIAYHENYEFELRNRRVSFADEECPDNWEEILRIIEQPRASPEPISEALKEIYNKFKDASNEAAVIALALDNLPRERWYNGTQQHDNLIKDGSDA